MNILRDKKGLSRLEMICIVGICAILAFFLAIGIGFYRTNLYGGDDGMRAKTATRVADVNIVHHACVVSDCGGHGCEHTIAEGVTRGYYDAAPRKIIGEKPAGYNESVNLKIGDRKWKAAPETMILQVEGSLDEIKLTWIEGDNR